MKRTLLDTNVVIDFLANREPFSIDSARLFNLAYEEKIQIFISALSYSNIHYILRRSLTNQKTISLLEELASMTTIVNVTDQVIRYALKSGFKDFEDAIQYYSAISIPKIDFIVTRNTSDFKKSELPVLTPSEAVALQKHIP